MIRIPLTPLLVLTLACACDCGDDDLDAAPADMGERDDAATDLGTGPDPLADFAGDYARAYCAKLAACFGPAADELSIPDCENAVEAEIEDALIPVWRASESDGNLVIDEARADECVEAIVVSATCADLNEFLHPGCIGFLQPQAATGGSCLTQQDCPLGDYCDVAAVCPGTCTTFAAVGASCEGTECAADAYCDEVFVCQALPELGDDCDLDIACTGLLFCASDGDPNPSCQTVDQVFTEAEGDPCLLSAAGPFCEPGLSCVIEGAGFVCRPLVGSGEACVVGFPEPCPEGEACDAPDGVNGTCTPSAGLGDDCIARPCGPGLVCGETSGTCLSLARLAEACTEDIECGSRFCDEGACASPECTL